MVRAAALQNPGTGLDGRASGKDIIDQQDGLADHFVDPAGMDIEGLPDIAVPLRGPQPRLRAGPFATPQQVGGETDGRAALGVLWHCAQDGAGQQERLIVAARQQPAPMQRYGHDEVGIAQEIGAGPRHPVTAGPGDVGAVAVLERQHQTAAAGVVGQGRAGAAKLRRPGEAAGAMRAFAEILGERIAAARAVRGRYEGEALPAAGTEGTRRFDDFAATETQRRQHRIEQHLPRGGTDMAQTGRQHGRIERAKCAHRMAVPLPAGALWPYIRIMNAPDPLLVFDRTVLRQRRERTARAWDRQAFLKREIAERLVERLADVRRSFALALDLGCHGDEIATALRQSAAGGHDAVGQLVRSDLGHGFARLADGLSVVADEEALPFAVGRFDLVMSAMNLHWVNDLPGTLIQIGRILKPDGLFLGAMLGGGTLWQLRQALAAAESEIEDGLSPRVSPFADLRDAAGLLQRAGFALPVADGETIDVEYDSALALMRDLGAMGESNLVLERRRGLARRTTLLRAAEIYGERFALPSGRVAASFEVLFLHGWAPHASQPKPLKPGSAARRLADALETAELSAGEKVERS